MKWSLSNKEALILSILADGADRFGLQLVELSNSELKRGTVYVTLGRMEERGLIVSRQEDKRPEGGLPRRLYRATALGLRLLELHQNALRVVRDCEVMS